MSVRTGSVPTSVSRRGGWLRRGSVASVAALTLVAATANDVRTAEPAEAQSWQCVGLVGLTAAGIITGQWIGAAGTFIGATQSCESDLDMGAIKHQMKVEYQASQPAGGAGGGGGSFGAK